MKHLSFLLLIMLQCSFAQTNSTISALKTYQESQNTIFKSKESSPLTNADRAKFKSLDFFEIDLNYSVTATFVRTDNTTPFLMKTSTDRLPEYVKYGELHFKLKGKALVLNVYQSPSTKENSEYADYLFVPFTDETNGETSYGGGRYLDFKIPESKTVVIDFNKAYNPYCAYSSRYSCPIPPIENHLKIAITAGVKAYNKY